MPRMFTWLAPSAAALVLGVCSLSGATAQSSVDCSDETGCAQACANKENELNASNDGNVWSCALANVSTEEIVQSPDGNESVHTTYWCNCVFASGGGDPDKDGDGNFDIIDGSRQFPSLPSNPDGSLPPHRPSPYQQCLNAAQECKQRCQTDCRKRMTDSATGQPFKLPDGQRDPNFSDNLVRCFEVCDADYDRDVQECRIRKKRGQLNPNLVPARVPPDCGRR